MIDREKKRRIFQRDEYTCRFCGHRGNANSLVVDHSRPVARQGTDHGNSTQTACWVCNALKGDMTSRGFEAWLRRTFGSRWHYAKYTAAARANGRVPHLDDWLERNQQSFTDWLFEDWSLPAAHEERVRGR